LTAQRLKWLQLLVLVASAALLGLWYRVVPMGRVHLTGDEPHYIMIAQSIATDGDIDLRNNYEESQADAWFPGLGPTLHAYDYLGDGRLTSQHTPGLPLLLVPAHMIDSSPTRAARLTMLAISTLILHQFFLLCLEMTGKALLSLVAWLVLATSVPMLYMSSQVYADVPAALFLLIGIRSCRRLPGIAALVGAVASIVYMPFLHVRTIPLSLGLAVAALVHLRRHGGSPKQQLLFLGACTAGGLLFVYFYLTHFGNPLINAQYAHLTAHAGSISALPRLIMGLLFDREVGVIPVAPVTLLCVAGAAGSLTRRGRTYRLPTAMLALYWVVTAAGLAIGAGNWGWAYPWRMIFPVYPLMALLAATAVHSRRGLAALAALLVLAGAVVTVACARWTGGFYWRNVGALDMPVLNRVQTWLPSMRYTRETVAVGSTGPSNTGKKEDNPVRGSVCAIEGRDAPEFLSWGIHAAMLPGEMEITLTLRGSTGDGAPPGSVQILRERTGEVLASHELTASDLLPDGRASVSFEIESDTALTAETRVYYSGAGTLCLEQVRFEQTRLAEPQRGYRPAGLATLLMVLLGVLPPAGIRPEQGWTANA